MAAGVSTTVHSFDGDGSPLRVSGEGGLGLYLYGLRCVLSLVCVLVPSSSQFSGRIIACTGTFLVVSLKLVSALLMCCLASVVQLI